jgi:thioredoxin-related protein
MPLVILHHLLNVFVQLANKRGFTKKKKVRTSQETYYVSATKSNQLMLFGETVAVYCENHTKHTNTLCKQNAEFFNGEDDIYIATIALQNEDQQEKAVLQILTLLAT